MSHFLPAEIIKKKRNGHSLTNEEIDFFIQNYSQGKIPDYQMSALTMAIYFRGMTETETLQLTKSMLYSGEVINFNELPFSKVDKHSTGGVGDKTSLILGPIVAAAGVAVPMISGRGLGHTGGTLDKLESIPGFNTQLDLKKFRTMITENKLSFIGQTLNICPADKKIYALRDVTATVESLPLICASIMSKKLAEGIDALVLDVKFGSGAFMKTAENAEELALQLMSIAKGYGKKVAAVLSNMDQPLGRFAGNSLEVQECIEILQNKTYIVDGKDLYADTRELSLILSGLMLWLGGKVEDQDAGYKMASELLANGSAYKKFLEVCEIHGGNIEKLPLPKNQLQVLSTQSGFLESFNTEAIGIAGLLIKAGRTISSDIIEPTAGIEFHKKISDAVKVGDVLFTIYGAEPQLFNAAQKVLESAYIINLQKPQVPSLVKKTLL